VNRAARKRGDSEGRLWKVGQLAKATGISVRTLHYYDEIGLLKPSHHSRSNHRLYGEEDIMRLSQIVSLRQLGFSLDEITEFLGRKEASPLGIIEMHLARLREQMELTQKLCARLEGIAAHLASRERASVEELLQTIEVMNMFEKYYTKEQLSQLEARRRALGDEAIRAVEAEWPTLIERVRDEMNKGTPPTDEGVQRLAQRWMELVEQFTGGDPGIQKSLNTAYASEPAAAEQHGLDQAIFAYVGEAFAAAKKA